MRIQCTILFHEIPTEMYYFSSIEVISLIGRFRADLIAKSEAKISVLQEISGLRMKFYNTLLLILVVNRA